MIPLPKIVRMLASGVRTMVVQRLPKPRTRVRFPYPAPLKSFLLLLLSGLLRLHFLLNADDALHRRSDVSGVVTDAVLEYRLDVRHV